MNGFTKGMVTGLVVGAGISMVVSPMDEKNRKKFARNTNRMFTTIGTIADDVLDMVK